MGWLLPLGKKRKRRDRDSLASRQQRLKTDSDVELGNLNVGKLSLHYAIRRGEGTPLLLCNGIGANIELALPFIKALPKRPVVIIDVPGTGGSPSALFWPRLKNYARWLVAAMDQLGFEDQFAVAGVSWGGGLAQQIVHDFPQRASHLILLATSPGIIMFPGKPLAILRMATPQRYLSRDYMARNASTLYGGEFRRNPRGALSHAGLTKAPSTLAYMQQLTAMAQFSSLPWLHKVKTPALVIAGDDDPLIHDCNGKALATLLPNGKLEIIRGGGHLFMTMRAEETASLIDQFLSQTTAPE